MTLATLESRGLTKTYRSTDPPTTVITGIDLTVTSGEYLVIMGASGSGKSTLLAVLSGMDRPTSGTVRHDGRDLTALTDEAMSRVRLTRMGYVFQQPYFLATLTIRDNVLLAALKAAPREQAATIARVDALLDRFGIAAIAERGITQVSGGQLQRAAICRALAAEPSVLFADEPTGALNSSMSSEVLDVLTQVHRDGTTIVMATHDTACAARADRVVYLRDGLLIDTLALGRWSQDAADDREVDLVAWLRRLDV
ncbi:ABC transporter ATP-binding protein [Ruania alba]|uniref:Putative ABC transport system ATP-binding protein n=1 Tax=Ruania alba TaxID=648782 RepID=A0A1H5N0B8_9MICO|nr:ABC transporter ATP-binding protein [Ruania alba]SEE94108.1 putative ABC transport system ATP-binding protein [Ruania alba]